MKQKNPILRESPANINWNIVLNSPHAVAYRLWTKQINEEWQIIGEGGLSDENVDTGEFEAKTGTQFAYWLGFGSNIPQSRFNLAIILTQANVVLTDGVLKEEGNVGDDGVAQILEIITFI